MSSNSEETIMSVSELIDNAFGDQEVNIIHHKLLQTVLYLLARQLRVLERRVAVQVGPMHRSSSSLSVTEVKLHAMINKKKKTGKSVTTPAREKTTSEKISSDVTSSTKKITYPKFRSDKTSDKTSSDKTSTDKTSSDKSTTDKTSISKSTTDKSSSDQPPPGIEFQQKETTDKKVAADKISSGKAPTDKTITSITTDKTPTVQKMSDQTAPKDKSYSKQSSVLEREITYSDAEPKRDYLKLLEQVEEMRERELRVIHQRADSREEHEKTPTPMASLESIVERVPAEEAKARAAREKSGARSSQTGTRLSVVTQDQFKELALVVRQLQEKFGPVSTPGFPENAQLMNELRKGASLTDAMAALQLSARLEAAEKTLKNMLSLVTSLASRTPGVNLASADDVEVIFGAPGDTTRQSQAKSSIATKKKPLSPARSSKGIDVEPSGVGSPSQMSIPASVPQLSGRGASVTGTDNIREEIKKDRVTYEELDTAMQELRDDIMKKVTSTITRSAVNADNALRIVTNLEGKIETSLNLGNKMENLETLVANYVEQINVLDTGLSSQMTNYQEELTQMQHDLEVGLETMADVLANTGGDATAVAELNAHFSDLQANIDETASRQKELRDMQCALALELETLRKQIEVLSETKSDRDEVVDALRDKAGLGALNGLVSHQQFDAVRGDFEKRIATAYDKFNNQEVVWQKAIDDLLRELNEKADLIQVQGLREEIYRYLVEFRNKVKFIMDIVGEPNAAALSKKLNRDTACLSCAAPAHMKPEEPRGIMLPAMRPPTIAAEAPKPKEDGDHGVCIPGQPIPHPRDPRSHVCHRWCGGSHTVVNNALSRAPAGVIITPAARGILTSEQGVDGKMYAVDEPRMPCSQCVPPTGPPSPVRSEEQGLNEAGDSGVLPYHMCPGYVSYSEPGFDDDVTPPPTALDSN